VATIGFKYFSKRQLIFVGAILLSMSYGLSAFATSIETTMLSLGVLGGRCSIVYTFFKSDYVFDGNN